MLMSDAIEFACYFNDNPYRKPHSEGGEATASPERRILISALGTASVSFKNLRFFEDPMNGMSSYDPFSYYWKLAHKALHNYAPISMSSLVCDIEFHYFGKDNTGAHFFNQFNSVSEAN